MAKQKKNTPVFASEFTASMVFKLHLHLHFRLAVTGRNTVQNANKDVCNTTNFVT